MLEEKLEDWIFRVFEILLIGLFLNFYQQQEQVICYFQNSFL
jgi:hypothetical protein